MSQAESTAKNLLYCNIKLIMEVSQNILMVLLGHFFISIEVYPKSINETLLFLL